MAKERKGKELRRRLSIKAKRVLPSLSHHGVKSDGKERTRHIATR